MLSVLRMTCVKNYTLDYILKGKSTQFKCVMYITNQATWGWDTHFG